MSTVVFDFDGVLIRRDSTVELLRRRLAVRPTLAPWLLPGFVAHAAAGGNESSRTRAAERIISVAFAGLPHEEAVGWVRAAGAACGTDPRFVVADAVAAIRSHQDAGETVLVASAGLEPFIEGFLAAAEVSGAIVLGSTLGRGPRGAVLERHNFGSAKVTLTTESGHRPPWARVYSDSLSDLPLLRLAEEPVLVNASPRMTARAAAVLPSAPVTVAWR